MPQTPTPTPAPQRARRVLFPLALLSLLAACADRGTGSAGTGATGGTFVAALPAEPEILLPTLMLPIQSKMIMDLVFDPLAAIGPSLNTRGDADFRPVLAERWTWGADSLSIAFHLSPRARWHDGRPLRAEDVRFSYALARDTTIGPTQKGGPFASIDSVTTPDSLTAVFWYSARTPERFYDIVHDFWIAPSHLMAATTPAELRTSPIARQPVGTGRFRLDKWEAGSRLVLVADTANWRGRAALDRVIWTLAPDANAKLAQLLAGEIDGYDGALPTQLKDIAQRPELAVLVTAPMSHAFVSFNLRERKDTRPNALFADRAMRTALTQALDRQTLVRAVYDTVGYVPVGPITRALSLADPTVPAIAFDSARAGAALDSLGWRRGADGMRAKGGRALAFSVLVPSVSAARQRMAVLMQESWRAAGIRLDIETVEPGVFVQRMGAGDFDLLFLGLTLTPSVSGLRTAWTTGAPQNAGGWSNPSFDASLDSALAAWDPAVARRQMRHALETIVADAPAIWMYEAAGVVPMHRRLKTAGVLPHAWWAGLADWTIPPAERIARDRVAMTAAADSAR
jgi:peptide/nickel transport system substrate-binding protein